MILFNNYKNHEAKNSLVKIFRFQIPESDSEMDNIEKKVNDFLRGKYILDIKNEIYNKDGLLNIIFVVSYKDDQAGIKLIAEKAKESVIGFISSFTRK